MLVIDPKLQFQNEKCSRLKCCDLLYYIAGSEPTLLPGSGPTLLPGSGPALLAGSQLIPGPEPGLYPGPDPGNPLGPGGEESHLRGGILLR